MQIRVRESLRRRSYQTSSPRPIVPPVCTRYYATVTEAEILSLFERFKTISSTNVADGVIDRHEFQDALGCVSVRLRE